ncbi:MAG: transporter [Prevotellaceae bacterium]|nr:transporter [Prevotellaceae bacterium]
MMPITMLVGGIFYNFFSSLGVLMPYMIFTMLFITFSGLTFRKIRFSKMHLYMLFIQLIISVLMYFIIAPFNEIVAQGVMICILMPTASSAPVITGMLGGSVASVSAYSLACNVGVAVVAPVLFSRIGQHAEMPFLGAFLLILSRMATLMILPFVLSQIVRKLLPKVNKQILRRSNIPFYIWTVALAVATGRTVAFVLQQDAVNHTVETIIALVALPICLCQFMAGRKIGKKFGDKVAGGQGLGQKNTILGIWMCQTYLIPIAAIGPGAYILWQNIVNSYQVWRNRKSL